MTSQTLQNPSLSSDQLNPKAAQHPASPSHHPLDTITSQTLENPSLCSDQLNAKAAQHPPPPSHPQSHQLRSHHPFGGIPHGVVPIVIEDTTETEDNEDESDEELETVGNPYCV